MAFTLHDGGAQWLLQAVFDAGADPAGTVYVGLCNSLPETATTLATLTSEMSGNGYSRRACSAGGGTLTVAAAQAGYKVTLDATFTPSGGNIGPFKSWFACTAASGTSGLLIASGPVAASGGTLTLTEATELHAVITTSSARLAPKPDYNTPLDPTHPINKDIIWCSWMQPDEDGQDCVTVYDVSGNELNGTMTDVYPLSDVEVTGAGSTAYNQLYHISGTESGYNRYVSADGLYRIAYEPNMVIGWIMLPLNGDWKKDGYAYYTSGGTYPWSVTWTASSGTAPVPTVSEEETVGPWSADGLRFNGLGYVNLGTSAILNPVPPRAYYTVSGATGDNAVYNGNYYCHTVGSTYYIEAFWPDNGATNHHRFYLNTSTYPYGWQLDDGMYPDSPAFTVSNSGTTPPLTGWSGGITVTYTDPCLAAGAVSGFSIHVLAKHSKATNNYPVHVCRWGGIDAERSYILRCENTWKEAAYMCDGAIGTYSVNRTSTDASTIVADGGIAAWTLVFKDEQLRVYRDGVPFDAVQCWKMTASANARTSLGAMIGRTEDTLSGFSYDELRFVGMWKRPLTQAEIQELVRDPYSIALQG